MRRPWPSDSASSVPCWLGYSSEVASLVVSAQGIGSVIVMFLGGDLDDRFRMQKVHLACFLMQIFGLVAAGFSGLPNRHKKLRRHGFPSRHSRYVSHRSATVSETMISRRINHAENRGSHQ